MRREQTLEEISDGKLYDSNDMVKADCHDCEGAVTVVREWEILCSWIHMMYTDCRQDYRNQQSSFYRNIWNWE